MANNYPKIVLFAFDKHHYKGTHHQDHYDLFNELISRLGSKAMVLQVLKNADAVDFMASASQLDKVRAIILTDPRITTYPSIAPIIVRLVAWVRAGGTLILSPLFSAMAVPADFEKFMRDAWGLPWKYFDYSNQRCIPNSEHPERFWEGPYTIKPYRMTAGFIKGVEKKDCVFLKEDEEDDDDGGDANKSGVVVFKPFGDGRLGWFGDVNSEEGSIQVILAMCRL